MNSPLRMIVLPLCIVVLGIVASPSEVNAQQGPDAQVIEQLRKAGSDLSKPHPIEFFLYVPTRDSADRLASKIRKLQFEAQVKPAALGEQWLVLATRSLVPTEAKLVEIRKSFSALAAAEKGDYDGWGTPVVQ